MDKILTEYADWAYETAHLGRIGIPSSRAADTAEALDEERRLLYVAMTRAEDELDLVVPIEAFTFHQTHLGDRHALVPMSRFIPESIHDCFETRHWRDRKGARDRPARGPKSRIDITESIQRMW